MNMKSILILTSGLIHFLWSSFCILYLKNLPSKFILKRLDITEIFPLSFFSAIWGIVIGIIIYSCFDNFYSNRKSILSFFVLIMSILFLIGGFYFIYLFMVSG
jgi:tetrahydromethanopterin S-methyltransferase subunit E